MLSVLAQLLADPLSYVLAAVIGGGTIYVRRRIEKGVDHLFGQRLEVHKQSLRIATEQAKFDFQRQLAEFNLYAVKRHGAAEAVYAAIRVAHGHVVNLFGLTQGLTFEEYDEKDMAAFMTSRDVPSGKQAEILAIWKTERGQATKLLKPYLRMLSVQEAERKFGEAQNLTYLNELYMSDTAIEAINMLFEVLAEWLSYAQLPRETGDRWRPDRKQVNDKLERVHEVLRRELSEGLLVTRADTQTTPSEHGA